MRNILFVRQLESPLTSRISAKSYRLRAQGTHKNRSADIWKYSQITGSFSISWGAPASFSGMFAGIAGNPDAGGGSGSRGYSGVSASASRSNAIYGNSNTVQTNSNQNLIIIKF